MFRRDNLTLIIFTFVMNSVAHSMTVNTCVTDFRGSMNTIYAKDGEVLGLAKLFASESRNEAPFTLVSKDGIEQERHGTITTTIDLDEFTHSGTCSFGNRFKPLHSIDEDKPWRQFQMRFDSYYDSCNFSITGE